MRTKITCCKDCDKRHCNCHASCKDYIQEKQELEEYNSIVKEQSESRAMCIDMENARSYRAYRRYF